SLVLLLHDLVCGSPMRPFVPDRVFFCNALPTPEIYTLSLHDAFRSGRRIWGSHRATLVWYESRAAAGCGICGKQGRLELDHDHRSEEHTSELQSRENLVCRLLLEKKNTSSRWTISSPQSARTPSAGL